MKNLQEASERICELKGSLIAMDALIPALLETQPPSMHDALMRSFEAHAEAARTVMLNTSISDHVLATFERDIARTRAMLSGIAPSDVPSEPRPSAETVLLTTTRVSTFIGPRSLTGASGFFFRRNRRLFLVTNRHVLADESSGHHPDRIEIELHTDARDLTQCLTYSIPLYKNGLGLWSEATDTGGAVDVAVIEIDAGRLPANVVLHAFDATHLDPRGEDVAVGDALTVIGFPLGFHDTVHHLAVARSASLASAYGIRFQQKGYFLTDDPRSRDGLGDSAHTAGLKANVARRIECIQSRISIAESSSVGKARSSWTAESCDDGARPFIPVLTFQTSCRPRYQYVSLAWCRRVSAVVLGKPKNSR